MPECPIHAFPAPPGAPGPDFLPDSDRFRTGRAPVRVRLPFGEPAWLVSAHADAQLVLRDARFSRSAALERDAPRLSAYHGEQGILSLDPPDHTVLRTMVAGGFTLRRMEALRGTVRELAGKLLASLTGRHGRGPADLVAEFVLPLTVDALCALMGIPDDAQDKVVAWADAAQSATAVDGAEIARRGEAIRAHLAGLVAERTAHPTEDLLGSAARAIAAGDGTGPTENDLVMLAVGLVAAGYESTSGQLANSVLLLLSDRERYTDLCRHRERIPDAVEELLRYVPLQTAGAFPRYATEDVVVGGVEVAAGDAVIVDLSAVNRDPAVFADPNALDLERRRNRHLAFGHGVHHCLGAALARVELQVALEALADELPGLALAEPGADIAWRAGMLTRAPAELPVRW